MPQLVFLHGPGAGGCAEAFRYQLDHFRGSLAPTLPGHGAGLPCANVARYTEWVRGWLWAHSVRLMHQPRDGPVTITRHSAHT